MRLNRSFVWTLFALTFIMSSGLKGQANLTIIVKKITILQKQKACLIIKYASYLFEVCFLKPSTFQI